MVLHLLFPLSKHLLQDVIRANDVSAAIAMEMPDRWVKCMEPLQSIEESIGFETFYEVEIHGSYTHTTKENYPNFETFPPRLN